MSEQIRDTPKANQRVELDQPGKLDQALLWRKAFDSSAEKLRIDARVDVAIFYALKKTYCAESITPCSKGHFRRSFLTLLGIPQPQLVWLRPKRKLPFVLDATDPLALSLVRSNRPPSFSEIRLHTFSTFQPTSHAHVNIAKTGEANSLLKTVSEGGVSFGTEHKRGFLN